ncbi:MAG: hypothetical protein AAGI17_03735 [Planctomycetota bacterium]
MTETPATGGQGGGGSPSGVERAPLNRPWLIKIVIILAAVFAFGSWGLYDATVVYPARGEKYASYARYQYLEAGRLADQESPGIFRASQLSIENPADELARLRESEVRERNKEDGAENSTSGRRLRARLEIARERWLTGLSRVGRLDAEFTSFDNPRSELAALDTEWKSKSPPSPLENFDIPSQWLIAGVCYALSAYMVLLLLRVTAKKYTWNPAEMRLTIPGGASVTPADMAEELDKRKWDKFIVLLKVKQDHPKLGGQSIRFDTYRHARLEEWLLEMEAEAYPEEAAESAPPMPEAATDQNTVPADAGDSETGAGGDPSEAETA